MPNFSKLTGAQINQAFERAGLRAVANRHADVFNIVRQGDISRAVGTLLAGAPIEKHKAARCIIYAALSRI